MAEQREKVTTIQTPKAELRIEEDTGSAPHVGENIELNEDKFKVVEVSHRFSGSPFKHVVVITVEKPQPTVAQ